MRIACDRRCAETSAARRPRTAAAAGRRTRGGNICARYRRRCAAVTSAEPRFERRPPLRRIEAARLGLPHPQHLGERTRRADHLADGFPPAVAHEIVGVVALGQAGELEALARHQQRQGQIDGPISGAPAGGVSVEAEHRLVRHPPQQPQLIGGERRAERRDGRLEARAHHGDDVDIALDRDQRRALVCGGARRRDVVERRTLVEERRLRRIEVFRRRVLLERAAAEGDHAARADR